MDKVEILFNEENLILFIKTLLNVPYRCENRGSETKNLLQLKIKADKNTVQKTIYRWLETRGCYNGWMVDD